MKAAEDFLTVVVHAFTVAAGEAIQAISNRRCVQDLARAVVDSFVSLDLFTGHSQTTAATDGVQAYAKEVLTLGMIWWGFHDAIREGDGERVITYWRFLLVLFKAGGRRNYSCEAAKMLMGHAYFLSPRQAAQLQWSRFINTHGREGCNVPMDLHLEHLNKRLKTALAGLHSNVTPTAIKRIGRSLGVVSHICDALEQEVQSQTTSGYHPPPSFSKDFGLVLKCLQEAQVFMHKANRHYNIFTFRQGILQEVDLSKVIDWLRALYRNF